MKYINGHTGSNVLPCMFPSTVSGLLIYMPAVDCMDVRTIRCSRCFQ